MVEVLLLTILDKAVLGVSSSQVKASPGVSKKRRSWGVRRGIYFCPYCKVLIVGSDYVVSSRHDHHRYHARCLELKRLLWDDGVSRKRSRNTDV